MDCHVRVLDLSFDVLLQVVTQLVDFRDTVVPGRHDMEVDETFAAGATGADCVELHNAGAVSVEGLAQALLLVIRQRVV